MKTVLLVEDDKDIARALRLRISSHGYAVAVAHDAATALMVARKTNPDLIVLDISMPGGDGFVVAERMEAAFGRLPTIFITANSHPDLRAKALGIGAIGFFEKPLKADELIAAISAATSEYGEAV